MVAAFRQRRDLVVSVSAAKCRAWSSSSRTARSTSSSGSTGFAKAVNGTKFCDELMQREGVALVPGAAFGDDRWVRMSYAVSDKELEAAIDRIVRVIRTMGAARAA